MRRSSPGRWLQLLAVAHVGVWLVLHRKALAAMARSGFVASVPESGERATAFWFMILAPPLWTAGRLLEAAEDAGDASAQRAAGVAMSVAGAAGVVAMPVSPFWAVLGTGVAALRRAAHAER